MKLVLGLAERNVAASILTSKKQGDLGTARMMRAVRKSLQLMDLADDIQKMVDDAKELGTNPPDWDDLLRMNEEQEFEISKETAEWLRTELMNKDWSMFEVRGENNKVEKINAPVPPGQMEAVANLADILESALNRDQS